MDERLESLAVFARRAAGPALRGAEVALVVALGLVSAKLIWLVVEPGGAVSPNLPLRGMMAQQVAAAPAIIADTSRLTRENPFGAGPVIIANVPDAPETSLNLRLRGVRASTEEAGGIALITTPDNRTAAYAPGDTILDGVTVDHIYGDRITLHKSGQVEALMMDGGAGFLSVLTTPGQSVPATMQGTSSQARIARADLMSNITIDPVHSGSRFVGYRIGTRGDVAVLTRAGLQPGDVVVGLDGDAISDVEPAELARKFSDPGAIRLRIDRNGEVIDHTLAPEEAR